jgi:methanogenic corrinoid protein MtbC1
MTIEEMNEKLIDLSIQDDSFTHEVESLILSMMELDESRFDKVLTSSIIKFGFERTTTDILTKFMEKTGILWQTGAVSPAQEHFVSNLVRQKLILAVDSQNPEASENTHTFVLFLPEEEFHELGLLYCHYLLKKAGHKVVYLGQNVPFRDLIEIAEIKTFDFMMTSFTSTYSKEDIQEIIHQLSGAFPSKKIIIGGLQVLSFTAEIPSNIFLMKSVHDLTDFLQKI